MKHHRPKFSSIELVVNHLHQLMAPIPTPAEVIESHHYYCRVEVRRSPILLCYYYSMALGLDEEATEAIGDCADDPVF